MYLPNDWMVPNWSAPSHVRAFTTSRNGGVSQGDYGGWLQGGMNPGVFGEDDPLHLEKNRQILRQYLPSEPCWMKQVHGVDVIDASLSYEIPPLADAAFSNQKNVVCVVRTADCLPVFFTNKTGDVVAVAHAGWRGLAAGVLEKTVLTLRATLSETAQQSTSAINCDLIAYLGPAIGPSAFEVGSEVRDVFCHQSQDAYMAFVPSVNANKFLANIYLLAKQRLAALNVMVYGEINCTYSQPEKFFSYRRSHPMGHMASLIWLADER